jgi:hypothetical protein
MRLACRFDDASAPSSRRRLLRPAKIIQPGASFDRAKEQKRFEDLVTAIEKAEYEKMIVAAATANRNNQNTIETLRLQNSILKQAANVAQDNLKKRKQTSSHDHGVFGDRQTFAVDYCHVYQSTRKKSISSRLTQRAFKLGLQAIQKSQAENANKQVDAKRVVPVADKEGSRPKATR